MYVNSILVILGGQGLNICIKDSMHFCEGKFSAQLKI